MPYKGPMGRLVALLPVALWLTGCASGPYALVQLTPAPAYRAREKPLGPVHVKLETDRRPPQEHGVRKYPGRSYLGGNALAEPTGVSLLKVLARDLELTGVGREAGLMARDEGYVLGVTVEHLSASYNDGVETLVPVLPTSAIKARCEVRLVLRDLVGRVYMDRTFAAERRAVAAMVTGIQSTAASTLGAALRALSDEILPVVEQAVPAFWKKLGRRPPGGGGDTARECRILPQRSSVVLEGDVPVLLADELLP